MKIHITKKDLFWNYAATFFSMGIGYLTLPLLLRYLDEKSLGLWYILMSISGIANLFTFGFTPSFAKNITYCFSGAKELAKVGRCGDGAGEVDYRLMKKVIKTCKIIYFLIAALAGLILSTAGTFYIIRVAGYMMDRSHYTGWGVFLLAVILNLYYGYYASFLNGVGLVGKNGKIQVIAGSARILFMAVLMRGGMGFLGACIAYLAHGIVFRFLGKHAFYKSFGIGEKLSRIRERISFGEVRECFSIIWHNAWRDGIVGVADYLETQAGTIVCSLYLSLEETAVYSLSVQLVNAIGRIARSASNAYAPVQQSAFINNDRERLKSVQSMCVGGYIFLYLLGFFGLVTVGAPLVGLVRPQMTLSVPLLLGFGFYQFLLSLRNCYGMYLSGTNRLIYWKAYILSGAAGLCGQVLLMRFFGMGIWGIVTAPALAELSYNAWRWPFMVNRELGIRPADLKAGAKRFFGSLLR